MIVSKTEFIENLYNFFCFFVKYNKKYKFKVKDRRVGNKINNIHLIICNYEFVKN